MEQQSTAKGFAVLSASQIISKVLSLAYLPVLVYILKEDGYGVYSSTYIIYTFIYVITNSGIPTAISKLVSELIAIGNYKDAIKSFKMARAMLILVGLIMSLFMFFGAEHLAEITKSSRSALALKTLAPTIFFTSIVSAYRGYFQGRGNMTPTAVSQIIEQIVNVVFSVAFAAILVGKGVEYGAAGGTIGTSLGALMASMYLIGVYKKNKTIKVPKDYKNSKVKRYSNKRLIKKILNYSIPMVICIGLQNAGALVDMTNVKARLIVAGFGNKKDALFGWVSQYNSLINVPLAIIASLCAAIIPSISGAAAINDKELVQNKINFSFRMCFLISIPSAIGLGIFSKPIYQLLHFGQSYKLMGIGSVVVVLMAVVQIQTAILQGIGKLYLVTFYTVLGLIGKIITNYILVAIPEINILGVIGGNIVCFLIPMILNHITINRVLKVRISLFDHMKKPLISSIAMGAFSFIMYFVLNKIFLNFIGKNISNAIALIMAIIVAMFVYFYTLIVSSGITREDLEALPQKLVNRIPNRMLELIK